MSQEEDVSLEDKIMSQMQEGMTRQEGLDIMRLSLEIPLSGAQDLNRRFLLLAGSGMFVWRESEGIENERSESLDGDLAYAISLSEEMLSESDLPDGKPMYEVFCMMKGILADCSSPDEIGDVARHISLLAISSLVSEIRREERNAVALARAAKDLSLKFVAKGEDDEQGDQVLQGS